MWIMSGRGFNSRRLHIVMIEFDEEMLVNLVCPLTGGKLVLSEDKQELLCRLSQLAYPIRDGIPVLRYDQARELYSREKDNDGI